MAQSYDIIYLAPHLDDVALSCGGQVFDQTAAGRRVLIVTIMAGYPPAGELSPFAQSQHERWGVSAADVVHTRRREDIAACQILGADYQHWSFHDCIYRAHPESGQPFYTSDEAIFGPIAPAEAEFTHKIADELRQLPSSGRVIGPLAIGNHIDHQLTRQAAEMAFGRQLVYYEDYPYNQRLYPAGQLLPQNNLILKLLPLSNKGIQARLAAISAFQSQLPTLFGDLETAQSLVKQYIQQNGGEKWWFQPESIEPFKSI